MSDIVSMLTRNRGKRARSQITKPTKTNTTKHTYKKVKKQRVIPAKETIPTPPNSSPPSNNTTPDRDDKEIVNDIENQNDSHSGEAENYDENIKSKSSNNTSKSKKKLVQTHFKTDMKKTICSACGMSYLPYVKSDNRQHEKFHQRAQEGLEFSIKSSNAKPITYYTPSKQPPSLNVEEIEIYELSFKNNQYNSQLAQEFLDIVNTELNAPSDTLQFLNGPNFGKVFLAINPKTSKTIGIVSVERVQLGHWMILDTGDLVPKQKVNLILGISRIYVSRNYRGLGIGYALLQVLITHGVYGMKLQKHQIGWSQPSEFGGKLALKFNAVKHKSGKLLIPVYKEEEEEVQEKKLIKELKVIKKNV